MRKTVDILGINIDTFTTVEALEYIAQLANDSQGHYIVTPNPEFVMQSLKDTNFRDTVNKADLALPDGIGILWAASYLAMPLSRFRPLAVVQAYWEWIATGLGILINPKSLTNVISERITGADMIWELSKLAAKQNWSIFLLGAAPGVAQQSAERLQWLYPTLQITGAMAGPPYDQAEEIIQRIQETKPKFVFLALTAPKQLQWIQTYAQELPGVIIMGIGGALDFIAGGVALNEDAAGRPARRAPEWMQNRGLEWLWRFINQPRRWKRMFTAVFSFSLQVVRYKLAHTR